MQRSLRKWLFWISILILPVSIGMIFYISSLSVFADYDIYILVCVILLSLSAINLITLAFYRLNNKKWFRTISKISVFLFPLIYTLDIFDNLSLVIILAILLGVISFFALNYIFILRKADEKTGLIIFLVLITAAIIINRLGIDFRYIDQYFLPMTIILTACGIDIFGLRILLETKDNTYLKIISYLACTLSGTGWLLFINAMWGEKVSFIELIYFVPAFLLTLVVLFTLPISGYVNWIPIYKRVLKKIMIIWIFIFLFFSIRIVFPEYFKVITLQQKKQPYLFQMEDYKIENKNGLEPK